MTAIALRSLAERRLRATLTALAIVLGVAMVAGSLILTDTVDRAFTQIFSSSYTNTDLVVRGASAVEGTQAGPPTVPARLLAQVRDVPGVATAAGSLMDMSGSGNSAKLLDRDGEVITGGNPSFGFGIDASQPRFNPLTLAEGAWAAGPGQVVVDVGTARAHGFAVGDRVRVAGAGPVRGFTVSGLARFGDLDSLGGATIAVFDVPTARRVTGKTGFDAIQVALAPGASAERVAADIAAILPPAAEVRTGAEQAASDKRVVSEAITFIRGVLLAFGGIALFVGAFVIVNTLSITVAQRTRELATLRTLGASRRQVLRSVVAEAAVIGLAASLAGLAAGYGLARGLTALFDALGLELPRGGIVVAGGTVAAALLTGTLVTVLAGLVPAVRATRVPPIAAVREGAAPEAGRGPRAGAQAGAAAIAAAGALLALGTVGEALPTSGRMVALGAGALAFVVGVAMTSSRLVRPIAAVAGWPMARLGGAAAGLARDNAGRNPARTASTAAALMIGLALVTFVSVIGAGLIGSVESSLDRQVRSQYVVTSATGWETVPAEVGRRVAAAEGVEAASSVRAERALVGGAEADVSGVDPSTIAAAYGFAWRDGDDGALARLDAGGVVVSDDLADRDDLEVGSPVAITTADGATLRRTVAGVYEAPALAPLLGGAVISQRAFDATFPAARDMYVLADAASAAAVARAIADFPDTRVATADAFAEDSAAELTVVLNLLYVLLGLSVVVGLLGMVNTMVLAVHERTRELGMLRVVGMSRRQTRRMVRGESVITALIGAALGLPIGVGMAALVTRALPGADLELVVPAGTLAAFVAVAVVVGVVAAIAPARRAARLDVLRALQYE
ncbi:ABC transporter permease [Miltoncostaea marina]|uniref:ABC transporter permease n=1 Tax=Miltoncostaea marina TaxID=2843215 RepID=UPI001C3D6A69|nr:ABC transporter permease [Miltoncostaea marina]